MSLRLFLSADLAGSTAFKQNYSAVEWQLFFQSFYNQLPAYVDKEFALDAHRLALWKTVGDEIVFSAELKSAQDAGRMIEAFRRGAARYRKDITNPPRGLDLKCAGWTAGFPLCNLEVPLRGEGGLVDYIGPGMDIGFRLVKEASPRRLMLSVELAYILSLPAFPDPEIRVGRSVELKGVGKGHRYPALWLDCFSIGDCEGWDQLELDEEALRGLPRKPAPQDQLHKFCGSWLETLGDPFILPFIEKDPFLNIFPDKYRERIAVLLGGTQGPSPLSPDEKEAENTGETETSLANIIALIGPASPETPD